MPECRSQLPVAYQTGVLRDIPVPAVTPAAASGE